MFRYSVWTKEVFAHSELKITPSVVTDRLKGCTAHSISSKFLLEIESTFWFNQFLLQMLLFVRA